MSIQQDSAARPRVTSHEWSVMPPQETQYKQRTHRLNKTIINLKSVSLGVIVKK